MIALSNRITQLSESETLAMARKSRELKAQGFDVINLSLGEPDFFTPDYVKTAAKKAIDENFSFYTPVNGYLELRQAICKKLKRDNKLEFSPEQIVVSTGAKQALINTLLCLVNPGEEVIIAAPYWVSYRDMVKLAEGEAVYITAGIENDFKITPAQLEAAITPKTKVFMFSSPCNPTGSVYTREELKALADVFEKHPHVYILSDEIYEHINFSGSHESIAQFESVRERVIIINGVSKGFAMTGWRVGYLAAHLDIAKACTKLQGQFTSGTNSIAQRATIAAVDADPANTFEMLEKFRERRDLVLDLMKDIPGFITNKPEGAFYVFPNVKSYFGKSDGQTRVGNAAELCMYLLNKAQVALVPGDAFGDPECIRFSYATSNDLLIEAVSRLKKALAELE
ncbi:MAG: pyridoxal phosphate-dependent aminotransferase [Bacteroidales bacterium]|jgi:aspartate aminotransferase|nr:pyridoxal phosphate-dependent aminotransferase [Bacteroidales bacterium]NLM92531.1 pyridoxal phosphate-dependent aminotransferase [Bacteroidales bacterium]